MLVGRGGGVVCGKGERSSRAPCLTDSSFLSLSLRPHRLFINMAPSTFWLDIHAR